MTPPIPGMTKRPSGPDFMIPAFLGCFAFAAKETKILDAFIKAHPEHVFSPPRSPLGRMIDDATQRGPKAIAAFADYVAEHVWGLEESEETTTPALLHTNSSGYNSL